MVEGLTVLECVCIPLGIFSFPHSACAPLRDDVKATVMRLTGTIGEWLRGDASRGGIFSKRRTGEASGQTWEKE